MKNKEFKRVLVLSDLHCGCLKGLTPPDYWNSHREAQKILWDFYAKTIKSLGKIDLCLCNGDLVQGPSKKNPRQNLTTDMEDQINMATECLELTKAKKFVFTRGTCYHVETDIENEDRIASRFKSSIADTQKIDVNGCIIQAKHTTGKSGTAYGSATPLQSSSVVQLINDSTNGNARADIYVRSHIHEMIVIERNLYTAVSTPCLQMKGLAYGRKYSGFYDVGIMWIDIVDKNNFSINKSLLNENKTIEKERIIKV